MIEFRTMALCDAERLADLDRVCFAVPWSAQSFAEEVKNPNAFYLLAWEQEVLVGYGGFWETVGSADITNIAVHPLFRRRKIASDLLDRLIEEAKRRMLSEITLEVRESNRAAIALYESRGFQMVGMRKRFYRDPVEDALIMTKITGEVNG